MRAYRRLGVNNGVVREERQDSVFELPQGAPRPSALPQRSFVGPPADLKRKGVNKELPIYIPACGLTWSLVRRDEPGVTEIRS